MQETKEIVVEIQKNAEKILLKQIYFVVYNFVEHISGIILVDPTLYNF